VNFILKQMNESEFYEYHISLCPTIWDNQSEFYSMRSQQRKHMLKIVNAFVKFSEIDQLKYPFLTDVVLTGSSANYNWTKHSDIDLHLKLDYDVFYSNAFADNTRLLVKSKIQLWNLIYDVSIDGFNVELYPQDKNENHYSTGLFSVKYNKWIKRPTYDPPSVNDSAVASKLKTYKEKIEKVLDDNTTDEIVVKKLQKQIIKLRKAGLQKGGEFSTENLVFKKLRYLGLLDDLNKYLVSIENKQLTLD